MKVVGAHFGKWLKLRFGQTNQSENGTVTSFGQLINELSKGRGHLAPTWLISLLTRSFFVFFAL